MQRFWHHITLITCLPILCATIFSTPVNGSVVHGDQRAAMQPGEFESYAVGILLNAGHTCTVTLIGKRLGVTNRHCFIEINRDNVVPPLQNVLQPTSGGHHGLVRLSQPGLGPTVAVGLFGMQASDFYQIKEVWWGPSASLKDDWAVVRLDRSAKSPGGGFVGDHYPTFRLAKTSRVPPMQLISHAGYSETYFNKVQRGHTQHDCHVMGREGVIVEHDCANSRGASGGALWLSGSRELIAINSHQNCPREFATSDEACAAHGLSNGAVPIEEFRSLVARLEVAGN